MTNRYSFLGFLDEYCVTIPVIQRDYAFGREEEEDRRNKFLKALFTPITTNENKNFDFVYGRKDEKQAFMPLDGQQRVTTLWLIHWFLFHRAGRYGEISTLMKKFQYETRVSSTRFCKMLADWPEDDSLQENFIDNIKDSNKFDDSWKDEPTIDAMLRMLQAISDKVKTEAVDCNAACNRLLGSAITFDLLDMSSEEFKLTDSLYVKMNARGKQLTDFENWKAEFIDLLESLEKSGTDSSFTLVFDADNEVKKHFKTYKDYFTYAIEQDWTDLLWPDVYSKWNAYSEEQKKVNRYPTIDSCFMNLFYSISEMLHYRSSKHTKVDYNKENWRNIYSQRDNLDFLFNSLDALCIIKKQGNYWKLLFDNLSMFDKANDKDLFSRCINSFSSDSGDDSDSGERLNTAQKLIFHFILYYCITKKSCNITQDFKDVIRVIRNIVVNIDQFNEDYLTVNTNVRLYNLYSIFEALHPLISQQGNIYNALSNSALTGSWYDHEVTKAKIITSMSKENRDKTFLLEEMELFKGNLTILPLNKYKDNMEKLYNLIVFFSSLPSKEKSRLLVAFGFKGKNLSGGYGRFYGRDNLWSCIMKHGDDSYMTDMRDIFDEMTNHYRNGTSVEDFIKECGTPEWDSKEYEEKLRYYILKYPEIITATHNSYYYIGNGNIANGDFIALGSVCSWNSYNIDPFVYVLKQKTGFRDGEFTGTDFRYSGKPNLCFKNEVSLYTREFKWHVTTNKYQKDFDDLMQTNEYKNKDLIEQGEMLIALCRSLIP